MADQGERSIRVPLSVGLGTMIIAMHSSGIISSLPITAHQLGTDATKVSWIVVIYSLIVTGLLISCGRLGDRVGLKAVYLAAS